MSIQNLSEDIVLVILPEEPELVDELNILAGGIADEYKCDLIIDFSKVEVITSTSIGILVTLRDSLSKSGRRLFLTGVSFPTRCIFKILGIEELFEFCEGKDTALAAIECARTKTARTEY